MKFPKEYLEEIKQRIKVSDIVGASVQLKRRGREFVGLSPFSKEKTPSFTINDEKGFYHCFSSGEHGNIFDFLVKVEKLNFGDAVRKLAAKAGMPAFKFTKENIEVENKRKKYDEILTIALQNYQKNFSESESVKKYALGRGLTQEILSAFKIESSICIISTSAMIIFPAPPSVPNSIIWLTLHSSLILLSFTIGGFTKVAFS